MGKVVWGRSYIWVHFNNFKLKVPGYALICGPVIASCFFSLLFCDYRGTVMIIVHFFVDYTFFLVSSKKNYESASFRIYRFDFKDLAWQYKDKYIFSWWFPCFFFYWHLFVSFEFKQNSEIWRNKRTFFPANIPNVGRRRLIMWASGGWGGGG